MPRTQLGNGSIVDACAPGLLDSLVTVHSCTSGVLCYDALSPAMLVVRYSVARVVWTRVREAVLLHYRSIC